ncbi:MAG: DNA-3-methyladenine glycosylase I [Exilispira sp.]
MEEKIRCPWCGNDPLYIQYHDNEWGVAIFNDQKLFEMLILDCFQAGLSWLTILKKRENFRIAFDNFDPLKIANYTNKKINQLMQDNGIIRNKLKIDATIKNSKAYLNLVEKKGSFSKFLWDFVDGKPIINRWENVKQIPATSTISDKMSKELKKNGFSFVGSIICYAFMQAAGFVNDHLVSCFRYNDIIKINKNIF